ncbi:MAG: chemotaxis protein CheW [Nitrospirota bacterium]|nr:chemotaxis protein CheW [Nitrospirota bacterium]
MLKDRKHNKTAAVEETLQLVTFLVGPEEYGLDISVITEVIRPLDITPLPHMPRFIRGVINLRGTIIPVIDLRSRFGLQTAGDATRKTRMLIIRGAAQGLLGLVVDGVREVVRVPVAAIDPAPDAAKSAGADFIAGVVKTAGHLVILLDGGRILTREERASLKEARDVPA